jgi:LPXTG-motif cell wall-anchored protein
VTKSPSWRKLLAVPVALTLALGGALLGAGAANAAPDTLVVTSPAATSTAASRTVVFEGTGTTGASVNVLSADSGARLIGPLSVSASGNWSGSYTFADTAAATQNLRVTQVLGGSGAGERTLTLALPVSVITVNSPANGATVDSRNPVFTGTAPIGSTITATVNGAEVSRTNLGNSSTFSLAVPFAAGDRSTQTVTISGFQGGRGLNAVNTSISIPFTPLVVLSPTDGQALTSRTVTVTGTGIPNAFVNVLNADGSRFVPAAILVGNDGTWSGTGTFADDAATSQALRVTQTFQFSGRGEQTVNVTLPISVITVDAPAEGATVDTRTPVFTGTAPVGSTITATVNGEEVARVNLGNSSTFSLEVPFGLGDRSTQTVTISGFQGGRGLNAVTRAINIPATPLVVTTPTEGQALTSNTVTITGTGIPNAFVNVLNPDGSRFAPQVLVGDDGTWSTTGTFAEDAATAQSLRVTQVFQFSGRGDLTINVTLPAVVVEPDPTTPVVVEPGTTPVVTAPVVTAPVVTTPAATTPSSATTNAALASTGVDAEGWIPVGALLLLAGAALTFAARRKNASAN